MGKTARDRSRRGLRALVLASAALIALAGCDIEASQKSERELKQSAQIAPLSPASPLSGSVSRLRLTSFERELPHFDYAPPPCEFRQREAQQVAAGQFGRAGVLSRSGENRIEMTLVENDFAFGSLDQTTATVTVRYILTSPEGEIILDQTLTGEQTITPSVVTTISNIPCAAMYGALNKTISAFVDRMRVI